MRLDNWLAIFRTFNRPPGEVQIAESIAKNSHWIDKPRGVSTVDLYGFLDSAVWIIKTDWGKHRAELAAYNKHVLPYHKATGTVDALPRHISSYGGIYGVVVQREAGPDLRRALKCLAIDITGKPCAALVSGALNAALEHDCDNQVDEHNIDRL